MKSMPKLRAISTREQERLRSNGLCSMSLIKPKPWSVFTPSVMAGTSVFANVFALFLFFSNSKLIPTSLSLPLSLSFARPRPNHKDERWNSERRIIFIEICYTSWPLIRLLVFLFIRPEINVPFFFNYKKCWNLFGKNNLKINRSINNFNLVFLGVFLLTSWDRRPLLEGIANLVSYYGIEYYYSYNIVWFSSSSLFSNSYLQWLF